MTAATTTNDLVRRHVAGTDLLERSGQSKQTIVFLHGIGSRAASFTDLMSSWPAGPRLLAWNAPGYGHSAPLDQAWPIASDYARRLADVLSALHLTHVDIVAHSLGCLVAGAFGRLYGERTGGIAFMSPALGYQVPSNSTLPGIQQQRITELEALGSKTFAASRAPRLVHDAAHRPAVVAQVTSSMAAVTMPGYGQAVRMLASGDLLADAAGLRATPCVITGANDVITPPPNALALREALDSRGTERTAVSLIADAGHAVYLEKPTEVLDHLTAFFAGKP
jgi:pimeloyl-ACP methyl ester carboxylesterase